MQIEWQWKTFNELSNLELYRLLQLREAVFQLEQNCLYRDIDDIDIEAQHLLGRSNNEIIAHLRTYEQDDAIWIGRIVLAKSARGQGLGRELMHTAMARLTHDYPNRNIMMSAQSHLHDFYASLEFISVGKPYDDAGIEHITMQFKYTD